MLSLSPEFSLVRELSPRVLGPSSGFFSGVVSESGSQKFEAGGLSARPTDGTNVDTRRWQQKERGDVVIPAFPTARKVVTAVCSLEDQLAKAVRK